MPFELHYGNDVFSVADNYPDHDDTGQATPYDVDSLAGDIHNLISNGGGWHPLPLVDDVIQIYVGPGIPMWIVEEDVDLLDQLADQGEQDQGPTVHEQLSALRPVVGPGMRPRRGGPSFGRLGR